MGEKKIKKKKYLNPTNPKHRATQEKKLLGVDQKPRKEEEEEEEEERKEGRL